MADSLFSTDCLQKLEQARSWASAFDWRQRESEIREMLFCITQKVNQLHVWETQSRQMDVSRKQQRNRRSEELICNRRGTVADNGQILVSKGVPPSQDAKGSLIEERLFTSPEESRSIQLTTTLARIRSAVHHLHEGHWQQKSSPSATSITSARTHEAGNTNHNEVQRRLLVPILPGSSGIRIASTARKALSARAQQVQLRDATSSTFRSYPLYLDVDLGMEELGHLMDVEMAAVPSNCREDDDVQTTSDVLALGVDTVERYLSSLLLLADKYLDRPAKRRMDKLRNRILKQ